MIPSLSNLTAAPTAPKSGIAPQELVGTVNFGATLGGFEAGVGKANDALLGADKVPHEQATGLSQLDAGTALNSSALALIEQSDGGKQVPLGGIVLPPVLQADDDITVDAAGGQVAQALVVASAPGDHGEVNEARRLGPLQGFVQKTLAPASLPLERSLGAHLGSSQTPSEVSAKANAPAIERGSERAAFSPPDVPRPVSATPDLAQPGSTLRVPTQPDLGQAGLLQQGVSQSIEGKRRRVEPLQPAATTKSSQPLPAETQPVETGARQGASLTAGPSKPRPHAVAPSLDASQEPASLRHPAPSLDTAVKPSGAPLQEPKAPNHAQASVIAMSQSLANTSGERPAAPPDIAVRSNVSLNAPPNAKEPSETKQHVRTGGTAQTAPSAELPAKSSSERLSKQAIEQPIEQPREQPSEKGRERPSEHVGVRPSERPGERLGERAGERLGERVGGVRDGRPETRATVRADLRPTSDPAAKVPERETKGRRAAALEPKPDAQAASKSSKEADVGTRPVSNPDLNPAQFQTAPLAKASLADAPPAFQTPGPEPKSALAAKLDSETATLRASPFEKAEPTKLTTQRAGAQAPSRDLPAAQPIETPTQLAPETDPVEQNRPLDPRTPSPSLAMRSPVAQQNIPVSAETTAPAPLAPSTQAVPAAPLLQASPQAAALDASGTARLAAQLESTIEQLTETRSAAQANRPEMTVRHQEFGAITMRLEALGNDLRATLSARDPGFVPAIQNALAERGVVASGDTPASSGQRGSDQGSSQSNSQNSNMANSQGQAWHSEGRYGSSTGSGQGTSQPYPGQTDSQDEDRGSNPGGTSSSGNGQAGDGELFA